MSQLRFLVDVGVGRKVERWLIEILRLADARANEKIEVLKNILRDHSDQIENSLSVYQDGRF
jgi:hypothetical protein